MAKTAKLEVNIVARVPVRVKIAFAVLSALVVARWVDHVRSEPGPPTAGSGPSKNVPPSSASVGGRTPCPAASLPDQGVCVPANPAGGPVTGSAGTGHP